MTINDEMIRDLAIMHIEIADEEWTRKCVEACCFALAHFLGYSPGEALGYIADEIPTEVEWFENLYPKLMQELEERRGGTPELL